MYVGRILFCILIIVLAVLCLFSFWNEDISNYEWTKQNLEQSKIQFLETKNKLENLVKNLKEQCSLRDPDLPIVYVITPTYLRPVQEAELTRISQTFRLVPNFHWILVEDSNRRTTLVTNILKASTLNYTHLVAPTPPSWKLALLEPRWNKPRGVPQRNAAIKWLRNNKNKDTDRGIVYFADDDNTYSLKLFQEMRYINKVGIWPVGLVGDGLLVNKPLIESNSGRVIGWNSLWKPERPFAIDMAGFAVNLQYLLQHPQAEFTFNVEWGYQETAFLSRLVTMQDLEPKADNCTKVYVWHTRTEEPILLPEERAFFDQRIDENIEVIIAESNLKWSQVFNQSRSQINP